MTSGRITLFRFPAIVCAAAAALLLAPAILVAQTDIPAKQDNGRKQARAMRVPSGAINVDGRLDDEVYSAVPAISDFIQMEPDCATFAIRKTLFRWDWVPRQRASRK